MTKHSSSTHGGFRPGSGRKVGSGRFAEPTQVIRLPQSAVPVVRDWLASMAEASGAVAAQPFTRTPSGLSLPLFGARIAAGFPSPADDHLEGSIDLNEQLVQHPAATFFVRVQGDSMTGAGAWIHNGDLLIVDRALEPCTPSAQIGLDVITPDVPRFSRTGFLFLSFR